MENKVLYNADIKEVVHAFMESDGNLLVVNEEDSIFGYIDGKTMVKFLLENKDDKKVETLTAKDIAIPLINKDNLSLNSHQSVILNLSKMHDEEKHKRENIEYYLQTIMENMPVGISIVSKNGDLIYSNDLATELISNKFVGTRYFLKNTEKKHTEIIRYKDNLFFRVCATPIKEGILITFTDISNEYNIHERLRTSQREAEDAFTMMLPDQRIESRLKSINEYLDQYDEKTGKIKITGVIKDGCFRHVINMLKLIADAMYQGLFELPGIEKNIIVQSTILHDIGKVQPLLNVGDVVNPKEVFEKGYLHAARSAELSKALYNVDEKVFNIIKFHHHEEKDLPKEFPEYLLPMLRFFKLIDGLSAGITRRGSKVKLNIVNGTKIFVKEESSHPDYNQEIEIDIYTGFYNSKKLL